VLDRSAEDEAASESASNSIRLIAILEHGDFAHR